MQAIVDLFYHDGEVQSFSCSNNAKTLEFVCGVEHSLDFRFCDLSGSPLKLIPTEKFGSCQILLSCRDRVLSSVENDISFLEDEVGFQTVHVEKLTFDSPAIRQMLAASQWALEPNYRGRIECDFSMAIYINEYFRTSIQLFFTLEAVLKQ